MKVVWWNNEESFNVVIFEVGVPLASLALLDLVIALKEVQCLLRDVNSPIQGKENYIGLLLVLCQVDFVKKNLKKNPGKFEKLLPFPYRLFCRRIEYDFGIKKMYYLRLDNKDAKLRQL